MRCEVRSTALALLALTTGCARGAVARPGDDQLTVSSRCAPDTLAVVNSFRYTLARFNQHNPRDSAQWSVFKAGYLTVRDTSAIRLITKESVCARAAAVYSAATGDSASSGQRRVTVVRAGDRFIIDDPFTPSMGGEWAVELIADRNWKVLVHLAR